MKTATGLAHIAIYTKDMENSIAFYARLGGVCKARDAVQKAEGKNLLALVDWAGFTLELIEPYDHAMVTGQEGALPHFAVSVTDLDAAIAQVKEAGVNSFLTDAPNELPNTFGGLRNIFFTGPDGESIELLQMLH